MPNESLSREQVAAGFFLMEKGGPVAEELREIFARLNQPLVTWCAEPYKERGKACGLTWEELLAAGNVGLLLAITKFDYRRGLKFSTCAVPWIRGEITAAFRLKRSQRDSDKRISQQTEFGVRTVVLEDPDEVELEKEQEAAAQDLTAQEAGEPESELLAEHADLAEATHQAAESAGEFGLNAQQARSEGIGSYAGGAEQLSSEDEDGHSKPGSGWGIDAVEDTWITRARTFLDVEEELLQKAVQRMPDQRQARVIVLRLGIGGNKKHSLAEVGEVLGVSLQRVAVIEKNAFAHLRSDPALKTLFDEFNQ